MKVLVLLVVGIRFVFVLASVQNIEKLKNMKQQIKKSSFFIIILCITLISCKDKALSRDEIVKNNAEKYLKDKMDDPSSYEFVELKIIDSVLFKDNIEYRKNTFNKDLRQAQSEIKIQEIVKKFPKIYDKQKVTELNVGIKKILKKIDSLESNLEQELNDVASYTYKYRCRGNNKLGVKILNEYIIQTNPSPDFKVINLTDNQEKVYLNPNDFPGYREMISKFYN